MTRPRGLAGLLAAAALLTACSADPSADGPAALDGAPVELRMLLFGGPEELEAYSRVAEAFHEQQPDIRVEVTTVATQDDLLARLTAGFAAETPPDVFLINFRKYGLYAEQGVLVPVQDFLDDEVPDSIVLSAFYPRPLDAFRFDGTNLTCLPQNISSLVTYVNLDLFDRAGITPPTGDWTWDEFKVAAAAIADLDPDLHGIGTSPSLIRLAPMVWSAGGEVVDDETAPTTFTLDSPAASRALDFFTSLVPERLAPDDRAEAGQDSEARFLAGTLGMFWSSRREVPGFRAGIDDFAWDVVPFPIAPAGPDGTPGERVTMLHSDAFCISRQGLSAAAWEFVQFALGPQGAPVLAESGRTVPSNRAIAGSDAFLREDVPPANAQVFLDNAEIVRATPSTASWNEVEKQADDILEELFYGRITREQALERLAAVTFR